MKPIEIGALIVDANDMVAFIHILSAASAQRGDADFSGTLRLLARCGEQLVQRLEELSAK